MPSQYSIICRRRILYPSEERQTMIDLLEIKIKDLVDNSVAEMKWVPTTHMLADILIEIFYFDRTSTMCTRVVSVTVCTM